jgi:hypothetical protein
MPAATTLLFGRSRHGSAEIRWSATEIAERALQTEIAAYRVRGGEMIELESGTRQWTMCGQLDRQNGPAIEYRDGSSKWYRQGRLHRVNGPAIINSNGRQEWWQYGRRHREDGPAMICADGSALWWHNGQRIEPPARSAPLSDSRAQMSTGSGPE